MRILITIIIVASATIANVACTDKTTPEIKVANSISAASTPFPADTNKVADISLLLQKIDQANNQCRSSPDEMAACKKRDLLIQEAEKAGWCWGPQDAYGYEKHWMQCSEDPARAPKRQWFAHDINHSHCISSPSPADKIREIQEFGQRAKANDLASGAVEVEVEIGNGRSQVWTFYRSSESCMASLPKSQRIDSKYE